jgi:hypothetical protein
MPKRKLDALGNMRGASGFANDEDRQKRLRAQLDLADSLADISKQTSNERALKNSQDTAVLVDKAPAALEKLTTKVLYLLTLLDCAISLRAHSPSILRRMPPQGGDFGKLTMPEMKSIAFVKFGGQELKGDKAAHVLLSLSRPSSTSPPPHPHFPRLPHLIPIAMAAMATILKRLCLRTLISFQSDCACCSHISPCPNGVVAAALHSMFHTRMVYRDGYMTRWAVVTVLPRMSSIE